MRETCQVALPTGLCGKPAVDFHDEGDGERFYLCAQHWDEFSPDFADYSDDDLSEEDFDDFD